MNFTEEEKDWMRKKGLVENKPEEKRGETSTVYGEIVWSKGVHPVNFTLVKTPDCYSLHFSDGKAETDGEAETLETAWRVAANHLLDQMANSFRLFSVLNTLSDDE